MEGGNMGPTTTSNSRPARTTSRYFTYSSSNTTFSGPVRRWQKKWVHVAPSQPSNKPRSKPPSNVSKVLKPPILLCKWTPLTSTTTTAITDGHVISADIPRRRFRYTPIAVLEKQKKLSPKTATSEDHSQEYHQSEGRSALVSDDAYGMLDMNSDPMVAHQVKDLSGNSDNCPLSQYSRRSHLNHKSNS